MADKPSVIRDTDDEARRLARRLVHTAPHASLAVIDPDNGFPSASRVLIATDSDGTPAILVSGLSAHTKALTADPRCSFLAGEQARGDPLAYPRVTVLARAETVSRDDPAHERLRRRFLNRHPKAKLYIDFPDFRFFRLRPQSASLNGGFARAYQLPASDLVHDADAAAQFAPHEDEAAAALVAADPHIASRIATGLCGAKAGDWRISGVDCAGIDLTSSDSGCRFEFAESQRTAQSTTSYMSKITYSIPEI